MSSAYVGRAPVQDAQAAGAVSRTPAGSRRASAASSAVVRAASAADIAGGTTFPPTPGDAAADAAAAAAEAEDAAAEETAAALGAAVPAVPEATAGAAVDDAAAIETGEAPWAPALHAVAVAMAAASSPPPIAQALCAVLTCAVQQPAPGFRDRRTPRRDRGDRCAWRAERPGSAGRPHPFQRGGETAVPRVQVGPPRAHHSGRLL